MSCATPGNSVFFLRLRSQESSACHRILNEDYKHGEYAHEVEMSLKIFESLDGFRKKSQTDA
jgi:hypothetical protein